MKALPPRIYHTTELLNFFDHSIAQNRCSVDVPRKTENILKKVRKCENKLKTSSKSEDKLKTSSKSEGKLKKKNINARIN